MRQTPMQRDRRPRNGFEEEQAIYAARLRAAKRPDWRWMIWFVGR